MIYNYILDIPYLFYNFNEIKIDPTNYNKYNVLTKKYMANPLKYFIWRNISMVSLLIFLLIDFSLNIASFIKIKNKINNANNTYGIIISNYNQTNDYISYYYIFNILITTFKFFFILFSIIYKDSYKKSRKLFNFTLVISVLSIYIIFSMPWLNYLQLNNSNITKINGDYKGDLNDNSYEFIFILLNYIKEIIPPIVPIFLGLSWASRNLKTLFPNDIIIGYFYKFGVYLFIITGSLLLLFNQITNSYLIVVSIIFYNLSLLLGLYIYRKMFEIYQSDEIDNLNELIQYNFNIEFIKNVGLVIIFACNLIYMLTNKLDFLNGIYEFHTLEVSHMIIRYIYYTLFYRVFFCDILFNFIINHQKYNILVTNNMKIYSSNMNMVNDYLYLNNQINSYNTF